MTDNSEIAIIGTGVMGASLALNLAEKGHRVALYDETSGKAEAVRANAGDLAARLTVCNSLQYLVANLERPRSFVMLVPAGEAVDDLIGTLLPLTETSDVLIDAGNANFRDTRRRSAALEAAGRDFLGIGVSGGAEGARRGPALMAGGSRNAWARLEPLFSEIAARHDGTPCCAWLGPDGAGHFVKTVHNGIEYADMQMIAEVYGLLRDGLCLKMDEIAEVFRRWHTGPLQSYLIEVTAKVCAARDTDSGRPLLDIIIDSAGQKGTGRWSVIEAQHLGTTATSMEAAVAARNLSADRVVRQKMAQLYGAAAKPLGDALGDKAQTLARLEAALYAGKIIAYAQGFSLLAAASEEWDWDLPLAAVARLWRAGCIIRSAFLDDIASALDQPSAGANLLMAPSFAAHLQETQGDLHATVAAAAAHGLPVPALSAALNFFDGYRTGRSTADLIQGQRDFFGAHGFERMDKPGHFHGPWST